MNYKERYNFWMNDGLFDNKTKEELNKIKKDENEIYDRFYKELEFGTGGLRGIIGAGTNRMNVYTVGKASQGLANFILKEKGSNKSIVIAYDSRHMSKEFAQTAALCFCANGIKTYLFEELRPTPELSYAIRKLGAKAGIVITASHNPAKYNGYKVYLEDGAQITPPNDIYIYSEIIKINSYSEVLSMDEKDAIEKGLLSYVGKEIDDEFIEEIKKCAINTGAIKEYSKDVKIVYTPLHGTGNVLIRRLLSELGFEKVYVVSEQELPDGDFPTVKSPNPEEKEAFKLALDLAKEKDADMVLATDPDADRLGVYIKKDNEYISLNGNMSGMLIGRYILREKKKKGQISDNAAIVKTIVTTNMAKEIATDYDVKLIEVLTGFKYIGEQIKLFEQLNSYEYVFGFEESYGCLVGTYARDKDACGAVLMLCEIAAYQKSIGKTIYDELEDMYQKYGYYLETLDTITIDNSKRNLQEQICTRFRKNIPESIGGLKVMYVRDYQNSTIKDMKTGEISKINLPVSDVCYYELEKDSWCCIRPSGTEPKIKFYFGVREKSKSEAQDRMVKLKQGILDILWIIQKNCE